jgi:hypothetical protein
MRRIGTIIGYVGIIVIFGGLLVGGIRFAQQQSTPEDNLPVVANPDQSHDTVDEIPSSSVSDVQSQSQAQSVQMSELPQTGLDGFLSVFGAGLMTAFVVAYIQSRRFSAAL